LIYINVPSGVVKQPPTREKGSATIIIYCDLWFDAVYSALPRND